MPMDYMPSGGGIRIRRNDFDIEDTLECGQCFRFARLAENEYRIVAFQKCLEVKQSGDIVTLWPCTEREFEDIWADYFDLRQDYREIKECLAASGGVMEEAIAQADGIRILNQDVWECLISFIISQNNNIPRIKSIIEKISVRYGAVMKATAGDYHSFPDVGCFTGVEASEMMESCRTGFRAKYVLAAAARVLSGALRLEELPEKATEEARKALLEIYGVGPKVADCVLLFSCRRKEVFPVDVWVKRMMQTFYFEGRETDLGTIHTFATETFGAYAGYAQQYLFHYARTRRI